MEPTIESPDGGVVKRTLVVCPKSVALQWRDEIEAKTPQLRGERVWTSSLRSFE